MDHAGRNRDSSYVTPGANDEKGGLKIFSIRMI